MTAQELCVWVKTRPITREHIRGAVILRRLTSDSTIFGCAAVRCRSLIACDHCVFIPDYLEIANGDLYDQLKEHTAHEVIDIYLSSIPELDLMDALV